MTRGTTTLAGLLLILATATGCGDDEIRSGSMTGEDTPRSVSNEVPETSDPALRDGPRIVLHDAGAESRSELRLDVEEGDAQHYTMTMTTGMQAVIDGERQRPIDTPPIEMGMSVEALDVAADGVLTVQFRYDDLRVLGRGPMADQIRATLAPMEDMEGTFRMSSSGAFLDGGFEVPDGLDPMLTSMMESMSDQMGNMAPPFPQEPVGSGASWTVHTSPAVSGIATDNAYHYTLVERRDDVLVLEVGYEQTADPQDVELPGMPAGTTMRVESMDGSGSGRQSIEVGRMLPVLSTMEGGGTIRMSIDVGGEEGSMTQEMELAMELRAD